MIAGKSLIILSVLSSYTMAQNRVVAPVQHLSFDAPEAWALKYFTSVTLLSGLEPPKKAWSVVPTCPDPP